MNWWARSRLRTKIFLAFSALVLAVLIATLGFTQFVVAREAERTLSRELLTTGELFNGLLTERAARLQTNSILLASDFALKRVIATHFDSTNYDTETLASAALNYHDRIGVDLLWIADESGELLVSSPDASQPGTDHQRSLADLSPVSTAVQTQETSAGIGVIDGVLYQLVAVPVMAPDVIGFLLLGQAIDDSFAHRLKQATGTDVSFLTEDRILASSWAAAVQRHSVPDGSRRSQLLLQAASHSTSLLTLHDDRYLALTMPVAAGLDKPLYALIQGSYDNALTPLRSLQRRVIAIGAAALVCALLIGIGLANGITSPLHSLVGGMQHVLKGNLHFRAPLHRQDEIGFLSRSFNDMVEGIEERERIRDTFGRFVSRDVAEAVLSGRVPLEGDQRNVTILFQDIRGFTALSERLDPAVVLHLLNRFFTEVVAAVEAEGGVVKQFLGDGVMALFGVPQAYADHAERATRAALGIAQRLHGLNDQLAAQGLTPLKIGIGIHTGNVVAGLIGPDNRMEYGVVGDAVNVASRIEALTKELSATILVSKEAAEQLGSSFLLGRTVTLPVKGRRRPVEVVEVLSSPTDAHPMVVSG